jgi:cytoskeletal protein CcmA (bactofilin family)
VRRLPNRLSIVLLGAALAAAAASPAGAAVHARRDCPAALLWALVSPAHAQEVLEFKPVSPESASRLERTRPARRSAAPAVPAPALPAPPAAPAEPAAPKSPGSEVSLGKSGNIMRVGSDIRIEREQVVVGDVMAVGGDITVDGHVEGDVVAMGGDVYLNATGRVDGDVVCMGGELHEEDGSIIGGQRVTATRRARHARVRGFDGGEEHGVHISGSVIWLLITLGLAWLFAGLAPGRTTRALAALRREPGTSAVTGLLAAVLAVPSIIALCVLVALLCITIIGIPLAIAALFGYFAFLGILWVWGFVIGAAAVGEKLARRSGDNAPGLTRAALYGVLLISGAGLVGSVLRLPGIGGIGTLLIVLSWLAFSGVTLIGAGALLRAEFQAGTLSRLWGGRRKAAAAASPAVESAPAAPAAPASGIVAPPVEPPPTSAGV